MKSVDVFHFFLVFIPLVFAHVDDMSGSTIRLNGQKYVLEKLLAFRYTEVVDDVVFQVYRGHKKRNRTDCYTIKLFYQDRAKRIHEQQVSNDLAESGRTLELIDSGTTIFPLKGFIWFKRASVNVFECANDVLNHSHLKTLDDRLSIWSQLLFAVYEMRTRFYAHLDLSPEAIMITPGDKPTMKLANFDEAVKIPAKTQSIWVNQLHATKTYGEAPEKLLLTPRYAYRVGYKTDVWSLGKIFNSMISIERTFEFGHKGRKTERVARISELNAFKEIIAKSLETEMKLRPTTEQLILETARIVTEKDFDFAAKQELIDMSERLKKGKNQ